MKRRNFLTTVLALPAFVLPACAAPSATSVPSAPISAPAQIEPSATAAAHALAPPAAGGGDKINAIATFSFIGNMVQAVAGDKIELTTLVGPEADVHDFEPVPSDLAKLAEAQLIFENGIELEMWLDNLFSSSGSKATRVVLSEGVTTREGEEHEAHEGEPKATNEADAEDQHEHDEFDPHIWQNPHNAIQMVRNISAALGKADVANATTYTANADTFIAQIEALDKEIAALAEQVPADKRKIVTSHDALGYFADRYGFTVVGSVIPALSTEAGDPSTQDIAKLVEAIQAEGVKAIFLESMANPQLVERVAQEAGVKVGPELYTDALGAPGSKVGTYIDALRFTARALMDSLK